MELIGWAGSLVVGIILGGGVVRAYMQWKNDQQMQQDFLWRAIEDIRHEGCGKCNK